MRHLQHIPLIWESLLFLLFGTDSTDNSKALIDRIGLLGRAKVCYIALVQPEKASDLFDYYDRKYP